MNKTEFIHEEISFKLFKGELLKELKPIFSICKETGSEKGLVYEYVQLLINKKIQLWLLEETFFDVDNTLPYQYLTIEFGKHYNTNIINCIIKTFFKENLGFEEFERYFLKMIEYKGEKYEQY